MVNENELGELLDQSLEELDLPINLKELVDEDGAKEEILEDEDDDLEREIELSDDLLAVEFFSRHRVEYGASHTDYEGLFAHMGRNRNAIKLYLEEEQRAKGKPTVSYDEERDGAMSDQHGSSMTMRVLAARALGGMFDATSYQERDNFANWRMFNVALYTMNKELAPINKQVMTGRYLRVR